MAAGGSRYCYLQSQQLEVHRVWVDVYKSNEIPSDWKILINTLACTDIEPAENCDSCQEIKPHKHSLLK